MPGLYKSQQGVFMQYGVIHYQIKAFDPKLNHLGLDITVASKARHKKEFELELSDFELLNSGHVMANSEFPSTPVAELFDKVVYKYFEQPKVEEVKKELEQQAESITVPVNGKIIKAIRRVGDNHEVITQDENPSEELKDIINKVFKIKGAADMKMTEQMTLCADKLRVGTLDIDKNKKLFVHTASGFEPVNGKVTRKQLIATLWFISKAYRQSPSFRKYLTVSVTEGKYTCGYKNGQPYFDTNGLSELEIKVINDLKLIRED